MNNTEALEVVLAAAESCLAALESGVMPPCPGTPPRQAVKRLARAIEKVTPRVDRMRAKLDFALAARSGRPKLPSWMAP